MNLATKMNKIDLLTWLSLVVQCSPMLSTGMACAAWSMHLTMDAILVLARVHQLQNRPRSWSTSDFSALKSDSSFIVCCNFDREKWPNLAWLNLAWPNLAWLKRVVSTKMSHVGLLRTQPKIAGFLQAAISRTQAANSFSNQ